MQKGSPDQTARLFVGKVNSVHLGSDPPLSWMCTRIDGVSSDGGETYRVTFEFQYNSRLWMFTGEWIDPDTGLPVPKNKYNTDENAPLEKRFFEVYDQIDFHVLGLDFSKALGTSLAGAKNIAEKNAAIVKSANNMPQNIEFDVVFN